MVNAKRSRLHAVAPAQTEDRPIGSGPAGSAGSLRIDGVVSTDAGSGHSPNAGNQPAQSSSEPVPFHGRGTATHAEGPKKSFLGLPPLTPIMKLGGAAAALGVVAVVLMVMQFGPDETSVDSAQKPKVAQLLTPQALAGLEPSATPAERTAAAQLLTAAAESAAPLGAEDALVAQMTAGTLAALRSGGSKSTSTAAETTAPASASQTHTALYGMVLRAVGQGQSPAYIDQMVNEAYRTQAITVPPTLIDAEGRVDTATILALFVGQ